jgi:hypothetical protein
MKGKTVYVSGHLFSLTGSSHANNLPCSLHVQAAHTLRERHNDADGEIKGRAMQAAMARQGIHLHQSQSSRAKKLLDLEAWGAHDAALQGSGDLMRRISDANPGDTT